MSMQTLEREIVAEARGVLKNKKLRVKDMQEWSTGPITAEDGEVVISLPSLGVNVAVKKECDKRELT